MHPSGDGDPAKSSLSGATAGQGGSSNATEESKKVVRRPVPVLVPATPHVPLAPIAPAEIPSTACTALIPSQHQAHVFSPAFATTTYPSLYQNHHPYHQQQLVPAPAHVSNIATTATTASVPQYLPTPLVFMNQKLRCGKWAPAEEAYAELLIEYFEKGIIVECENGVTLRSFLSRKLHCSPMRISKKYAGKGIGKKVFLSRLHGNSVHHGVIAHSEIPGAIAKLQAAEAHFIASLYPGCNMVCVPFPFLPAGSNPTIPTPGPVQTDSTIFPTGPGRIQFHVPAKNSAPGNVQIQNATTMNEKFTAIVPRAPILPKVVPMPPLPSGLGHKPSAATSCELPPITNVLHASHLPTQAANLQPAVARLTQVPVADGTTDANHSVQLQQSYINALKENGGGNVEPSSTIHPASVSGNCHPGIMSPGSDTRSTVKGTASSNEAIVLHSAEDKVVDPSSNKDIHPALETQNGCQSNQHGFDSSPLKISAAFKMGNSKNGLTTVLSAAKSNSRAQLDRGVPIGISATVNMMGHVRLATAGRGLVAPGTKAEATNEPTRSASQAAMPDLLAGFDKVSQIGPPLNVELSQTQVGDVSHQYSPAFTSRSFDDFHRFLGHEDLTPLSDAATHPREHSPSRPDANTSSQPVTRENHSAITLWQPPNDIPRICGEAELTAADAYAIFAQQSASVANVTNEPRNHMPPNACSDPSTEQLYYSDLSGMLRQSCRDEPIGNGQNQEERGQKRKLFSLEQQLPKGEHRNFMVKSYAGAASNSAIEYSGGALVSEASNSDSGSARGSVTFGSDEGTI